VTTLLDDLQKSGLLDETLVVWMGEFGHSPGINAKGGRDHWGHAGSAVLAGGGIQGGLVYGSTDEKATYPMNDPVMPGDMSATIFHALGIPQRSIIYDRVNRPHSDCRRITTEEDLWRNVVCEQQCSTGILPVFGSRHPVGFAASNVEILMRPGCVVKGMEIPTRFSYVARSPLFTAIANPPEHRADKSDVESVSTRRQSDRIASFRASRLGSDLYTNAGKTGSCWPFSRRRFLHD